MKVLLFGATGMVGQSVLRECLLSTDVESVLTVGRNATGRQHEKLHELTHANLLDLTAIEQELSGFDACFFCLGVSSAGMTEERYRHITYDLTLAVAQTLARLNPYMTFIYVSGAGTDSTERGRSMWARVKGETENALLRLPCKAAYMFRPGAILPLNGVRSKTKLYQVFYDMFRPLFPVIKKLFPRSVITSEQMGQAMIKAAKYGYEKAILESGDISSISIR